MANPQSRRRASAKTQQDQADAQSPPARIGRPPKAPEDVLQPRTIRLLPRHWTKIDEAGGIAWLRTVIERARPLKK